MKLESRFEAKLEDLAGNQELLEIGRQAVEAELLKWRDARLSSPMRGNGLVIREKDGRDSATIRFGAETCLSIGLKAIAAHLSRLGTEPY